MKKKNWRKLTKIVGGAILGVCGLALSWSVGSSMVLGYGYVGTGNATGEVPTNCNIAPNAIEELCPNHMGGASWRIYRVGTHYGPATPSGTAVLTDTSTNMDTISATCSAEKGFGWFVAYGWEGMNAWNSSGDSAKVGTSFGEPFLGSVQVGPANFREGAIAKAAYNSYNAVGSSYEYVQMGMPDNTRLTLGATEELYCNMMINDGKATRETCSIDGLRGHSYFCYTPTGSLTVNYVGNSTVEKDGCYGRKTIISTNEQALEPSQTAKDDDNDGRIDFQSNKSKYESEGWTLVDTVISVPENVQVHGDMLHVDVSTRAVEVTFKYEKKEEIPSDEPCDPECESWVPNEYVASTEFKGDTKVRVGAKNFTMVGWNDNGEWHHLTGATNGLMDGPIYAKPTDYVQFKYCYYPGVERAAFGTVTHENIHPEPGEMHPTVNHLDNHPFHEYDGWHFSEYKAWEDGVDAGFKPASEYAADAAGYYDHSEVGNDDPLIGTLPGGPLAKGASSETEDRQYRIQPWDLQSVDILYANHSDIAQKLDPGDTLYGHIITNHGYTHVEREEDKVHTWPCNPHPCGETTCFDECSHDAIYYPNSRDSHQEKDDASIIIPYNYKNRASGTITNSELHPGEQVEVENPRITVGTRENEETDGPDRDGIGYATDVPSTGKARVVAFLMDGETYEADPENSVWADAVYDDDGYGNESDGNGKIWRSTQDVCEPGQNTLFNAKFNVCKFLDHHEGPLNENAALDGATYDYSTGEHYTSTASGLQSTKKKYNVFDESAGNYFCVASAIYPFSVKSDTDTDPDGDQSWYVSKPSCVKITKKPVFQVWGSGIYTGGDANTAVTVKRNVLSPAGKRDTSNMSTMGEGSYEGWYPTGGTDVLFGSWVELSATLEGTTTTFASGASTGYRGGLNIGNALATWSSSGDSIAYSYGYPAGFLGVENGTLCQRSPMSIGNMYCSSYVGGFYDGTSTQMDQTLGSDVQNLVAMFDSEAAATGAYTYIEDGNLTSAQGVAMGSGNVVPSVDRGQTIVQVQHGDLNIGSDIIFTQNATTGLKSLRDIAKYIIYAEGNITIDCNVTRLDAVLIATGVINTCNQGDVNDYIRSHQLVINGAIISSGLLLNRTYGAGTGEWSVTPAELINYDTSLYLWSNAQAESAISGQVTTSAGQSAGVSSGTSEAAVRELAPRY